MKRDLIRLPKLESSFLSCEKDAERILKKLFVESNPYSKDIVKMLVVNTKDCLDNSKYDEYIKDMRLSDLVSEGYIRLTPKISFEEHAEVKSYILISFDSFSTTATNPQFRDCIVNFDILCHTDYWDIGDYRLRPLKIAGYIDGLLNNCKLTGIGTFQFLGCNELIINSDLSGYTLSFAAVHGTDDRLSDEE